MAHRVAKRVTGLAPANAFEAAADPRWRAVCARDPGSDGAFVFAVRTTGVYCRPSCAARRPRPENVTFHVDPAAARAAGFRACKRCNPDGVGPRAERARWVEEVCRLLAGADAPVSLATLAARVGLSAFHLQRTFRGVVGITPSAFYRAERARRMHTDLAAGRSVTAALQRAGYGSTSRFYGGDDRLGMSPKRARRGGAGERLDVACVDCRLGRLLVAATPRGVCASLLGEDDAALREDLRRRFPRAVVVEAGDAAAATGTERFTEHVRRIVRWIDAGRVDPSVPLDIRGTVFQRRVWQALRRVPAGQTTSYAALARRLGMPRGARAVARACADNPLAVVVPCHRVVRGDGELAGYRWGLARKQDLLESERRAAISARKRS